MLYLTVTPTFIYHAVNN